MITIATVMIKFEKLRGETSRAVLLLINGVEYWFPKRFCSNFILNKKLGGNMIIPSWLYREKFGCEPNIEYAETIIEKHKPNKIKNINVEPIKELVR